MEKTAIRIIIFCFFILDQFPKKNSSVTYFSPRFIRFFLFKNLCPFFYLFNKIKIKIIFKNYKK
ncbi:hypothetical protein ASJ82_07830 [Methanosphaera cuniculi]|uniref:Uncharacterized protein n=1 Tax=Methanosphaera cuniculi TaxID=1077256 RepID=A0A2A2HE47_9EURY|nr:hypothetical protein ASJ82_07830 [Methanosphaera cuniculi]